MAPVDLPVLLGVSTVGVSFRSGEPLHVCGGPDKEPGGVSHLGKTEGTGQRGPPCPARLSRWAAGTAIGLGHQGAQLRDPRDGL